MAVHACVHTRTHTSTHMHAHPGSLRFAGLLFWTPSQGKVGRGDGMKTYPKMLKEDTKLTSELEI